jgi:GNAT superfamily N-acetyltransferase
MEESGTTSRSEGGWRRLRRAIWSTAIYRMVRRAGAVVTRPFRRIELAKVFRHDLIGHVDLFEADIELDISRTSAEEVDRAAATLGRPDPQRRNLFRRRLENGCMCFVARAGSTMVAYDWFRFRPGSDDGDMIALGEGEVFMFDLYVHENWRGHWIHSAISSRIRLFCKEQGYTTAYTKISVTNRKSLRGTRGVWKASGLVLRVRRSKRGGWPIVTLWGSAHPLRRLRREERGPEGVAVEAG